jgi:DNA-binding MarR family transcriptional regulator
LENKKLLLAFSIQSRWPVSGFIRKILQADAIQAYDVDDEGWPRLQGNGALIYDYVTKHPGAHIREIRKNLGLGMGDLQYHLDILEKRGMINSVRRGLYRFVFPSGIFGDKQETVLGVLSIETEREILLFLSERPEATQQEISRFLKLSSPTIAWHMRRLESDGLVERRKIGKFARYKLNCDSEEVKRFVENYHPALLETWSSRLANTMLELSNRDHPHRENVDSKEKLESETEEIGKAENAEEN